MKLAVRTSRRGGVAVVAKAAAKPASVPKPAKLSPESKWRPPTVALLAVTAMLADAAPARADEVDSALDSLAGVIQGAGSFIKAGVSAAGTAASLAKQGIDIAAPIVKQGVDAATPIVKSAVKAGVDAAAPVVSEATRTLSSQLESTPVASSARQAAAAAAPVASSASKVLSSTDPTLLYQGALGAAALLLVGPTLLRALAGGRAGRGELSAARVLDMLTNGEGMLVDIRTQAEKEAGGVPDLPSSAGRRATDVEFVSCDDKRLRGMLRDPKAVEAAATALQVGALRGVDKSSTLVLMDRNGGSAQQVAREMARRGYGKVYTLSGGFDGRNGWVQSKLQIKPAASRVFAEPPSKTMSTRLSLPAPAVPALPKAKTVSTKPPAARTVAGSSKSASTRPAPAASKTGSTRPAPPPRPAPAKPPTAKGTSRSGSTRPATSRGTSSTGSNRPGVKG